MSTDAWQRPVAPGARLGRLRRALILRGTAGHHAFTEDVVRDPAIAALCREVTVREDPELNAGVPRLKPARVTVTFTDESGHAAARKRPRRLPESLSQRRNPEEVSRAGARSEPKRARCDSP